MRTKMSITIFAFLALLFVLSPTLRADGITLTLSTVTGSPGSTIDVFGTITNTSGETIFLNADNFSLSNPSLSLDASNFILNAPPFLLAGFSTGPFNIFTLRIDLSTPSGILGPNFFSILGGSNPSSFGTLGGAQFDVKVQSTTSEPEPSSSALVISGLLLLGIAQRKKFTMWPVSTRPR
jgi:hypothetical protein